MQVPIKLMQPIFGKFEHLAQTLQPTVASLEFVQSMCAQARFYYASEEKDYQPVMMQLWIDLLSHLGPGTSPSVGRNSIPDLAFTVGCSAGSLFFCGLSLSCE